MPGVEASGFSGLCQYRSLVTESLCAKVNPRGTYVGIRGLTLSPGGSQTLNQKKQEAVFRPRWKDAAERARKAE
jgi:hypothetical protein